MNKISSLKNNNFSVLWICVNYNSHELVKSLYNSISRALDKTEEKPYINFIIADNSENEVDIAKILNENLYIEKKQYFTKENIGYFGAAYKTLIANNIKTQDYDFTIISNVDVEVDNYFLKNLQNIDIKSNFGLIAPKIISLEEQIDKNPGIIKRPSDFKMKFYQLLYSWSAFYQTYLFARKIKLFFTKNDNNKFLHNIYAAHGSLLILCKNFFRLNGSLDYPIFLFGEEIFLAEEMKKRELLTIYAPEVKVYDLEHVTTNSIKIRRKCRYNSEAIKYLRSRYF